MNYSTNCVNSMLRLYSVVKILIDSIFDGIGLT